MKTKILKKIISIMIILLFVISMNTIYAANDTYQVKLEAQKNTFLPEEKVIINVKIENIRIETGEKGLGAYTAKLQYDSNLLEIEKIEGANEWETPLIQNGNMAATTTTGNCTSQSQTIAKITFKIKPTTQTTKTKIEISNFLASNGQNDILANKSELEITLEKDKKQDTTQNEITNNIENEIESNDIIIHNTVDDKNMIAITNTVNNEMNLDNTVATNKIPQTGKDNSFVLVTITILGVFAMTSIGMNLYQTQKEKNK